MKDITSRVEIERLIAEQQRPDGTFIPLRELYPDLFPPDTRAKLDIDPAQWLADLLSAARRGMFNAIVDDPSVPCGRHVNCTTFVLHFHTEQ